MHRDWKPDAGRGHRLLWAWTDQRLWNPFFFFFLKINSVENKGIHNPSCSSQHTWIFSCSAPNFPRAQLGAQAGTCSTYTTQGCQVAPSPPGACPHQAAVRVCWGETWWKHFTITSTTHSAVENQNCRRAWWWAELGLAGRKSFAPSATWWRGHKFNETTNSNPQCYPPLLL